MELLVSGNEHLPINQFYGPNTGCYQEIFLGRWQFKVIGKNVSFLGHNQRAYSQGIWGPCDTVSLLAGSRGKNPRNSSYLKVFKISK